LIDKGLIMFGSFGIFFEIEIFRIRLVKKTLNFLSKEVFAYNKNSLKIEKHRIEGLPYSAMVSEIKFLEKFIE